MKKIIYYNRLEKIRKYLEDKYPEYIIYAALKYVDTVENNLSYGLSPLFMLSCFDPVSSKVSACYLSANIRLSKARYKDIERMLNLNGCRID